MGTTRLHKTKKHASVTLQMPRDLKNTLIKLAKVTQTNQSEVVRRAVSIFDLIVTTAAQAENEIAANKTSNYVNLEQQKPT